MNKHLETINKQIENGLDNCELLKARRKLYKIDNLGLDNDEYILKYTLLRCISELMEEVTIMQKQEKVTALEVDNNGNHFKVVDGKYHYISESEYNSLKEIQHHETT